MGVRPVTWTEFFFSPDGRFNRAQYWGSSFAVLGAVLVYLVPLTLVGDATVVPPAATVAYEIGGAVLFVAVLVAHVFTIVKRFHDRDKSWPWCLILFVPYIGSLWILIECGCLEGTPGPNAFDPPGAPPTSGEVL